jgi:hypothetical protein
LLIVWVGAYLAGYFSWVLVERNFLRRKREKLKTLVSGDILGDAQPWPITGSMADRRLSSRDDPEDAALLPETKTRRGFVALWPR